jgi:hypothetical protein
MTKSFQIAVLKALFAILWIVCHKSDADNLHYFNEGIGALNKATEELNNE